MALTLVVVTGPPGSGKTTIARDLADAVRMPLIAKDALKVVLYETLGWGGVERDRELGAATYELMWHIADELLRGASLILEANFRTEHASMLGELSARHGARVVQIHCSAAPDVLERRVRERERHPGHADLEHLALGPLFALSPPLDLPGELVRVDTTRFEDVDRHGLLRAVTRLGER